MRKNIVLSWDTETGLVYDAQNNYVCSSLTLMPIEVDQTSTPIEDLVKLRNAGFTTDEIIELKRKELI